MKKRVIFMMIGVMCCMLFAGCGKASVPGETESVEVNADSPNYSEENGQAEDKTEIKTEEKAEDLVEAISEEAPDDKTEETTEEKLEDKLEAEVKNMVDEDGLTTENDREEPFGTPVEIDKTTQKKMNIFLSNFSEAGFRSYDKDARDIRAITYWAHIWTKINKNDFITYENRPGEAYDITYEKISLDDMNYIIDKYLGFKLTDDMALSINDGSDEEEYFFYENGNFYAIAADGESYTNMSVVTQVEDLGDNRLKLCFGVYSQDLDAYFDGKEIDYTMTGEEAAANPEYELWESGYAIVSTDGSSYKLEYLEQK